MNIINVIHTYISHQIGTSRDHFLQHHNLDVVLFGSHAGSCTAIASLIYSVILKFGKCLIYILLLYVIIISLTYFTSYFYINNSTII